MERKKKIMVWIITSDPVIRKYCLGPNHSYTQFYPYITTTLFTDIRLCIREDTYASVAEVTYTIIVMHKINSLIK